MEKRWRQGGRCACGCRRRTAGSPTLYSVFFFFFLLLLLLLTYNASAITFDVISTPTTSSNFPTVVPTIVPSVTPPLQGSSSPTLTYWNSNIFLDHSIPSDHEEDNDDRQKSTSSTNKTDNKDGYSVKDKALAWAPKFSAFLSICGSSFIIYDVIGTGQAFHSTNHRLLMGMSICTLLVSLLAFFMSTWPIPAHSGVYLAAGNQTTCDVQGFFAQFSLAVVMYNASLSAYYVAKVVYQCKTNYVHYRLEPFLHICPLTAGLGTALAGVFLDLYNNDGGWGCWIAAWPEVCNESWAYWQQQQQSTAGEEETMTCIRGDNASIYRWVFYYGILWLAIPFVLINMSLVYRAVYAQEKKMNQYNFEYQRELERLERLRLEKILASMSEPSDGDSESEESESASDEGSVFSYVKSMASASVSRGVRSVQSVTRSSVVVLRSITTQLPGMEKQHQSLKAHFAHSRRVSRQGYWFCGAFLATWVFPTVHRLVQVGWKMDVYPLHLLTAIFIPLQGFINALVYYQTRIKKKHIMNAFCFCIYLWKHPLRNNLSNKVSTLRRNVGSSNLDLLSSDSSSDDEGDKPSNDNDAMDNDMSKTICKRPSLHKDHLSDESREETILKKGDKSDRSFDLEGALQMTSEVTDDDDDDEFEATRRISKKYHTRPSFRNSASFRANSASFRANSASFRANSASFRANSTSFRGSTGTTLGGRSSISTSGGRSLISRSTSGGSSSFGSSRMSSVNARRSTRSPQHASLRASLNASVQRWHMQDQSFQSAAASELTGTKSNHSNDHTASFGRSAILEDIIERQEEFHPFEISTTNGFSLADDNDDLSSSEGDGTNTGAFNGSRNSIDSYLSGLGSEDFDCESSTGKQFAPPAPRRENSIARFRFVREISSRFRDLTSTGKDSNEKPKPVEDKDELADSYEGVPVPAPQNASTSSIPFTNVA